MTTTLQSLRAPEHREFIAPLFGAPPSTGEDPQGLTYFQILANPKLAELGRTVYNQLRLQFAEDEDRPAETEEQAQYRLRLESWAQVLEIMLDEVLNELESLKPARPTAPAELI
jgi:hypothetical protein